MQTVRTIIWVIFAVALTIFAVANFTEATVRIWPGVQVDTYLSVIILFCFALGFLPPFLISVVNRWRMRRKLNQQEALIAQLRPAPAPSAAAPSPVGIAPLGSDAP